MMRFACTLIVLCLAGCGDPGADPDGGDGPDGAPLADGGVDAQVAVDASVADGAMPDAIELTPCALDDVFTVEALDVSEPGSEGYAVPSTGRLDALGRSIELAIDGDLRAAVAAAAGAEYAICEDGDVLIWRPTDATGQARVAWRRSGTRGLILEAPHPFHDRGTLEEARELFDALGARVMIGSGTHRCASAAAGCEGTSSACGDPAGYRRSDAAHNVIATFHRAHERFAERFDEDVVVSVHGMGGDGASLSDGTRDPVTETSHVARLAAALVDRGVSDVTACNPGAGVPVVTRLCGTTNTQGRHVNGSPDACGARAEAASGRFLHFEQSAALRDRQDDVLAAFDAAF